MSSSLASQLAARTTLDSTRLASTQALKYPASFIYTPKHAASITTNELHTITSNAWDQLASIDTFFERYQDKILGEEAKRTDRSTLTKEENEKLDKVLNKVLRALGKHMLLKPAGVVLEWLVRRFRVNDLNAGEVIALFLPYHTTPYFPSALKLIQDPVLTNSIYTALIPTRTSLAPLPLKSLIAFLPPFSALPTARPFLDFILHLPLAYLEADEKPHRALVGFWLQVVAGYLDRAGATLPAGEKGAVLSTILEVLKLSRSQPDTLIAAYILLARYSMNHPFEGETLRVVMKSLAINRARGDVADQDTDAAFVTTLVVVSQLGKGELEVKAGKPFLGGSGWKGLIQINNLDDLLVQLCNEYNAERFMKPFLRTLVSNSNTSPVQLELLKSLLTPRATASDSETPALLPDPIVALIASSTISYLLASASTIDGTQEETDLNIGLIKVLNQVYQRWPEVWEASTSSRLNSNSQDAEELKRLWLIINSVLSGGEITKSIEGGKTGGIFLSSSSPDVAVRLVALNELLATPALRKANPTFVHDTLLARLAETKVGILNALFSPKAVTILHSVLSADEIFTTIQRVIGTPKRSPEVLGSVLKYLAGPFVKAFPTRVHEVFEEVFFSRLLPSMDDYQERVFGWEAFTGSELFQNHPWFGGDFGELDLPTTIDKETLEKVVLELADHAVSLTERISKSIQDLALPQQTLAINFLVARIVIDETTVGADLVDAQDATSQLLALAILGRLVGTRGDMLDVSSSIIEALKIERLGLDAFVQRHALRDGHKAAPHPSEVVRKYFHNALVASRAKKTIQSARKQLIETVYEKSSTRVRGLGLWFNTDSDHYREYNELIRLMYRCAHTGNTPGGKEFGGHLLNPILNIHLRSDPLSFFASIWTDLFSPAGLKIAALQEAGQYLATHSGKTMKPMLDYQSVLPALLVGLQDIEKGVREEAMRSIVLMRDGMPEEGAAGFYGRGTFYGVDEDVTELLNISDEEMYLSKLIESKVELVMDGTYLATFHSSVLDNGVIYKKKKDAMKLKISTFIISHVATWTNVSARTLLLRSLSSIVDVHKSTLLVPLLAEVTSLTFEARTQFFVGQSAEIVEEYCQALLQPYSEVTKKYMDGSKNAALEAFSSALEIQDDIGAGAILRKSALNLVHTSVFSALRGANRIDLFKQLVRLASLPESRHSPDVLACLRACKLNGEVMTSFFNEIRVAISGPANKAAKRGRVSTSTAASRVDRVPELVVALETVDYKTIAVTHGLLLALFDLLSTLIEVSTSTQVDIQYAGQLMLATLSKVIENVKPDSGITNDSIRMSPVLDLMRASTNPQTSHQALLLLSQLGPLVPEQLVHNVMPIFTFMGSNVLQRDDAYSLRVVERTLESIVPALVTSMKTAAASRDALVADLRDLLRVFTDAASHVPRHRRIKLFVRFVETLGAREFLSAVTMLLLDKNHANDAAALPLAVVESFPVEVQLTTILHYIEESSRLLRKAKLGARDAPFLEPSASDSADVSPNQQIISLVNFTSIALDSRQLLGKIDSARAAGLSQVDTSLSEIVRSLLDLAALPEAKSGASDSADLTAAMSDSLQSAVRLMSTKSFSEAILWLIDLADPMVRSSALGLLRTRLPSIKPARRPDISPAVIAVVDRIRESLDTPDIASAELEIALETLHVVATSVCAEEDAALAKTVPVLITVASRASIANGARSSILSIIKSLSNRLGPRLIPLVSKLIPFTLSILKNEAKNSGSDSRNIVALSFQIIEGLFTSIPTFIGTQLDNVFSACLSAELLGLTASKEGPAAKARASLLSAASKKLPAKTIYPAIIRLHASLDESIKESMIGLLDLLNRALRQGKTAEIAESYRPVFKLFLTIFDLRRVHPKSLSVEDINDIEENALGAFVQFILKLNEQTFRPLFLRTYDWAVIDLADQADSKIALTARRTILYKLVDRLLVQLKSIVVPYFSFMLDQTIELLDSFSAGDVRDSTLWSAVTSSLTKALHYDETGFWTPLRLGKLSTSIANQLQSPHQLSPMLVASHYTPLLAQYAQALAPHEDLLKSFNTSLLMLTRSDDLRIKKSSIEAIETLWDTLGDGMLGLVPETCPFLAELIEETEGGVEEVCRRLIKTLEEHLGESLDSYLGN